MSEQASWLPSEQDATPSREKATSEPAALPQGERRLRRRARISALLRVRGLNLTNPQNPDEVLTTIDVSRIGLLFLTCNQSYATGTEVAVTFPYSNAPTAIHAEQIGRIVRVVEVGDGRRAIAIALGRCPNTRVEEIIDASGRELVKPTTGCATGSFLASRLDPQKPLILAVDTNDRIRESLKTYFVAEGYEVIAVNNAPDARQVLEMTTPSLMIAEVEGEGLPGFDLCALVKGTDRLRHIPVVLTTTSAYPSDYANAHSLGAVVCMAKPYKQERLGHVVRLLAPTLQAKHQPAPRSSLLQRRTANSPRPTPNDSSFRRWKFPFS